MTHSLTPQEQTRYARHINLPGFGPEAQLRLAQSSVLIIGAGGLGSPAALYLAAAGIGNITIADGDKVDLTNLQRQIIHTTADIDTPKTQSAANKLHAINPHVNVQTIDTYLTPQQMAETFVPHDFIIDATDSPAAKFAIDTAALKANKPYSHGSINRFQGQCITILPDTARLTDLFPDGPVPGATPDTEGPVGALPGIIGSIQAAEAIKYIAGIGQLLTNRLLMVDILTMKFTTVNMR